MGGGVSRTEKKQNVEVGPKDMLHQGFTDSTSEHLKNPRAMGLHQPLAPLAASWGSMPFSPRKESVGGSRLQVPLSDPAPGTRKRLDRDFF